MQRIIAINDEHGRSVKTRIRGEEILNSPASIKPTPPMEQKRKTPISFLQKFNTFCDTTTKILGDFQEIRQALSASGRANRRREHPIRVRDLDHDHVRPRGVVFD